MQAAFTRGSREHKYKDSSEVGPAGFYLPPVVGSSPLSGIKSAPAFSLKPRGASPINIGSARDNPGPGAYDVGSLIGKSMISTARSAPSYTLRPRHSSHGARSPSPSPAEYSPNASLTLKAPPSYSIGVRTALPGFRTGAGELGPGAYDVISITGIGQATARGRGATKPSSPAFSLRARTVDPAESARARSPAPSPFEYQVPTSIGPSFIHHSNGAFSIRSRPKETSSRGPRPGPADYSLPSALGDASITDVTLHGAPSFSFSGNGQRSQSRGSPSPGPAAYSIPSTLRSMSPTSHNGITLKHRPLLTGSQYEASLKNPSPGPAAYDRGDVTVLSVHSATRTPGLSRAPRLSPTSAEKAAASGPATLITNLDMSKVKPTAPSFTMRSRIELPVKHNDINGPAAYNLQGSGIVSPSKKNGPAWSLGKRWDTRSRDNGVPGPGAYGDFSLPFLDAKMNHTASGSSGRPRGGSPSRPASTLSPQSSVSFNRGGLSQGSVYGGGSPSHSRMASMSSPGTGERASNGAGLAAILGARD